MFNKTLSITILLCTSIFCLSSEREVDPMMTSDTRNKICEVIYRLPNAHEIDHSTFIKNVEPLIRSDMDEWSIRSILDGLSGIPADNLSTFLDQVNYVIDADMDGNEIANVIVELSRVPLAERNQVFMDQIKPLIESYMDAESTHKVITGLLKVPEADRSLFMDQVKQIIRPDMCGSKYKVVDALSRLHSDNRQIFVDQINNLILPEMSGHTISIVVEMLSQDPSIDLCSFIDQFKRLIQSDMDGSTIGMTISVLLQCSPTYLPTYVDHIQKLLKPDMNQHAISVIIASLSNVPSSELLTFMHQVRQLIRQNMNGNEISVIVELLSKTLSNERSSHIARTLLFEHGMQGDHTHIRQALETPLNQMIITGDMMAVEQNFENMEAFAQGENPYEAGINMHASGRDRRAINAVQTLLLKKLTPEELDNSYNNFLSVVRNQENPRQQRILRNLGIDQAGNVLPKPDEENFSGLITGVNGSSQFILSDRHQSITLNGRDIVARFWNFANTYDENVSHREMSFSAPSSVSLQTSLDRENMQIGVMDALEKGVNEFNTLRCEMGRIQLLAVATIQGRLRNDQGKVIDIDGLGLNQTEVAPIAEAPEQPAMIINFDEISLYLQPFVQNFGPHIINPEHFYTELFRYLHLLNEGLVMADGTSILLNPPSVVYYVRMMEPATFEKGRVLLRARINPEGSLVSQLGFDSAFSIVDYQIQFGVRDQYLFNQIQRR